MSREFKKVDCAYELYSGYRPETNTLEFLYNQGFSCIWNLAEELEYLAEEEREYCALVIEGRVRDYSIPENKDRFMSQTQRVADLLVEGKKVFVHCLGGRGRTAMGLASILIYFGRSAEEALASAYLHCNGPELDEQIDFIKSLKF